MGALISLILYLVNDRAEEYRPRLYYAKEPAYFVAKRRVAPVNVEANHAEHEGNGHSNGYKNGDVKKVDGETEVVSIRTFLERRCPGLLSEYRPTWWLPTGHLKTVYCIMVDWTKTDVIEYERTYLRVPDGGTLGLDFTPPSYVRQLDPKTPIIAILHGLSGGSYEYYIRQVLTVACRPKEEGGLGYRACVVNFRGCAGVPLTTVQMYSGANADDFRTALLHISQTYPGAPLIGLGFSLGAGVLTKYIGEEGDRCRLRSGCVLGCPWDMARNSDQLENRWFYRTFYSRALGTNLLYLLRSHLDSLSKLPPSASTPYVNKLLKLKSPRLREFDENCTRFNGGPAPLFPLPSADVYYLHGSSHHHLPEIKTPFLALSTEDDPVVAVNPIVEAAQSKWVALAVTKYGGHLGWFEGGWFWGIWGGPPPRWVNKPTLEWLKATGEDLGKEFDGRGRGVWEKDGFVLEEGRKDIGYRVLSTGERIGPPKGREHWAKVATKLNED